MATVTGEVWTPDREDSPESEELGATEPLAEEKATADRKARQEALKLLQRIVLDLNKAAWPVTFKVDVENLTIALDWTKIPDKFKLDLRDDWPTADIGQASRPTFELNWDLIDKMRTEAGRNTKWVNEFVRVLRDPTIEVKIRFTASTEGPVKGKTAPVNMLGPTPAWIMEKGPQGPQINIYWNAAAANRVSDEVQRAGENSDFFGSSEGSDKRRKEFGREIAGLAGLGAFFVHETAKHRVLISEHQKEGVTGSNPVPSDTLVTKSIVKFLSDKRTSDERASGANERYRAGTATPEDMYLIKSAVDWYMQAAERRHGVAQQQAVMEDLGYGDQVFIEPYGGGPKGKSPYDWPGWVQIAATSTEWGEMRFSAYLEADNQVPYGELEYQGHKFWWTAKPKPK